MNADESAGDGARRSCSRARRWASRSCSSSTTCAFVMGLAERVTVLDFGRSSPTARRDEVQHDPEVLRAYLGSADGPRRPPAMNQFLELLLSGLSLGCIYGLIAMGFVIVFKATNVVNFAHASVRHARRLPGRASGTTRSGFFGAIAAAAVACAVAAALLDVVFVRPLRRRSGGDRRAGDHDDRAQHPARHRSSRAAVGNDLLPVRRAVGLRTRRRSLGVRRPADAHRRRARRAGADGASSTSRFTRTDWGVAMRSRRLGPGGGRADGHPARRASPRARGRWRARWPRSAARSSSSFPAAGVTQRDRPAGAERDPGGGARRPGLDRRRARRRADDRRRRRRSRPATRTTSRSSAAGCRRSCRTSCCSSSCCGGRPGCSARGR